MKFHLICQEESANVKKLSGNKKKKSWEMWRKALSNYSVYLGSTWWNIYITATEVLKVIKLAGRVSSLFPHFSGPFQERRDQNVDKATFPGDAIAWWPRCSEPPQTGSAILASLNATGNPLNLSGWESAAGCDSSPCTISRCAAAFFVHQMSN